MQKEKFRQILESDSRYDLGAYKFILTALSHTQQRIVPEAGRHVSGQQLLEGIKSLALEKFGPLGGMVFKVWGIQSTVDIGNIVFNLVEHGFMGKREDDTLDDFSDGFDVDTYFWKAYIKKSFEENEK